MACRIEGAAFIIVRGVFGTKEEAAYLTQLLAHSAVHRCCAHGGLCFENGKMKQTWLKNVAFSNARMCQRRDTGKGRDRLQRETALPLCLHDREGTDEVLAIPWLSLRVA